MNHKICHITSVHPIDDIRIFIKECTSLAANGFDVSLIACGDTAFANEKNGVRLISLHVPVKNRLQRFFKRSWAVYKKAMEVNANVYHFHDPELFFVGYFLKRKKKIVIFDAHEDFPQQLKQKSYLGVFKFPVSFFAKIMDKILSRKFDLIIAATPYIAEKYKSYKCNTVIVKNYPKLKFDNEMNWKNKTNSLCYIGGLSENRGIFNMLDALGETEYSLELAGNFSETETRTRAEAHPAWSQVNYHGFVSQKELVKIYTKSKIGIGLFHPAPNHNEGISTKLYEYMYAGLPVIVSDCVKSNKETVLKHKCGIVVNPFISKEIITAIEQLMNDDTLAQEMGNNGRKAVEELYNWNNEEKKLLKAYFEYLK